MSEYLISCARAVTQGDTKENIILLHKCFLISTSGDVLIDPDTCRKIVAMLATPLKNDDEIELKDTCASFLAQIMPVICGDSRQQELQQQMFVILFEFSVANSVSDYLSEDTLWEVTTAWQDALSDEDLSLESKLVEKCTYIIDKELKMFTEKNEFNLEHFEKLTKICTKLMTCSTESVKRNKATRSEQIAVLFESITKQSANEIALAKELLEKLSTYIELLNVVQTTKSNDYSSDLSIDAFKKNMQILFVRELFCLNVVYQLSCDPKKSVAENNENKMDHDGDDEDNENMNDRGNFLLHWSELIYEKVLSVIYTVAIGNTLLYSSNDVSVLRCITATRLTKLIFLHHSLTTTWKCL